MKIGVAIAARDEGPDLEATVALLRASDPPIHDLVVVDDASQKPIAPRMPMTPVYSTTHGGVGPAKAKQLGVNMLRKDCDIVVVSDAHMRMPKDWTARVIETLTVAPEAALCFNCRGFERGSTFSGYGARWDHQRPMELIWGGKPKAGSPITAAVPGLMGGFYAMCRETWRLLGNGFNPGFTGWGYEETDLSYRLRALGRPLLCLTDVPVLHEFRRNISPNHPSSWQPKYNIALCCYCLLEDEKQALALSRKYLNEAIAIDKNAEAKWDDPRAVITRETFRKHVQRTRLVSEASMRENDGFGLAPDEIKRSREVVFDINPLLPDDATPEVLELWTIACAGKRVRQFGGGKSTPALRKVASYLEVINRDMDLLARAGSPARTTRNGPPESFARLNINTKVDVVIIDRQALSPEDLQAVTENAIYHLADVATGQVIYHR